MARIAFLAALGAWLLVADVRQCACDPGKPETMSSRECSLCSEAEKQTGAAEIFFLKDVNPRKPNRWLALPARTPPVGITCTTSRSLFKRSYGGKPSPRLRNFGGRQTGALPTTAMSIVRSVMGTCI
jgi:hypothetical protein